MKKIFLLLGFCAVCLFSNAQSLPFVIPIDGSIGDVSVPANAAKATAAGWILSGTFNTGDLSLMEPDAALAWRDANKVEYPVDGTNVIFQNYPFTKGVTTTATAIAYPFASTAVNSGTLYMTFMFQGLSEGVAADLGQHAPGSGIQTIGMNSSAEGTSGAGVRLWMRKNTVNDPDGFTTYNLAITRSGASNSLLLSANTATKDLVFGETHLLVMKYDFVTMGEDKVGVASLFIDPVLNTTTEPAPDAIDNVTANTTTALKYMQVRINGSNAGYYYIGGIRISNSWQTALSTGIKAIKADDDRLSVAGKIVSATTSGTLTIYSPAGIKVFQSAIDKSVDTSLPAGIYVAHLTAANGQQVNQKIVIK